MSRPTLPALSPTRFGRAPFLRKTAAVLLGVVFTVGSLRAVPANLTNGLKEMATDYRNARTPGSPTLTRVQFSALAANYPLARVDHKDRVQVDVALDGTVSIVDSIAAYKALGCKISAQVDWYRQGLVTLWLPLDKAPKLGRMAGVSSVKLALKPFHRAGKVPGTGAKVLNALEVQTENPPVLGTGIKVGVLSDSYNVLSTSYPVHAPQDVASYDLPGSASDPYGNTTPVTVVKEDPFTSGRDEGRAMLQIVHDVAPAASLYFYTADASETDFANGITTLQATDGCNVICDDVGYYDEPAFSDGVVAQAVDTATAGGAVYFSAAGNDGNSGFVTTFSPVANNATTQGYLQTEGSINYSTFSSYYPAEAAAINEFHSFGTNPDGTPILVQKVYIPPFDGTEYTGVLTFQWDDPDGLTNNSGVKQITTDYDLLVFSVANGVASYQSSKSATASNFSTNTPVEVPGSNLNAGTQYEFVMVLTNRAQNANGPTRDQATHLRWDIETDNSQIIADFVGPNSPNSFGHSSAATCAGTAAYVYDDQFLASDTTYTPTVEQFSSNGPATIYFDSAGNRLATPVTRKQPLLSAVDGVSTTFFPATTATTAPGPSNPSPNDSDGDGYPNFFGTSAAAPHAAGCAALILSAAAANGITLTPADVRSLLADTTQGQNDQDPGVSNTTAGATTFSARDRHTYSDPGAYTITYNGAAGTTLNTLVFDLTPLPGGFYPGTFPVTTSAATSGTVGGTAPSIASSTVAGTAGVTTLTLTFSNFTPGSTLSFGVAQTVQVAGGNFYTDGDHDAGATITATDSTGTSVTGTLANTFSKAWNYKTGFGLIDVNAAINRLLGK